MIFLDEIFFKKIRLIFDIENWLWKYNFVTFWGYFWLAKLPGSLEIWKFIDEPDLLVWILYQCWHLNLNCLASILKFGKISTIQIGWNYSQLNIRTTFCHVLRRTFLLYLNDSMMDLTMEIEIDYLQNAVLYLTTYFISKNVIKLSQATQMSFVHIFEP